MVLILHIGPSRTATTTLQKHLFPRAEHNLILSKRAYSSSFGSWGRLISFADLENKYSEYFANPMLAKEWVAAELIFPIANILSRYSDPRLRNMLAKILESVLEMGANKSAVCLSSEIMSETPQSLTGATGSSVAQFDYIVLCDTVRQYLRITPQVIVCMRDPLQHIVSKYTRCLLQRKALGKRLIMPEEYVSAQVAIDKRTPSSSAIAPAFHSRFLKEICQVAYVHAYGFSDMLSSVDAFKDFGLTGERPILFNSLPQENVARLDPSAKRLLIDRITHSLKAEGQYDLLMQCQLYV